ncbi:MAG: HEAT repeat domain-containing protein [Blastocatellia bacterium]|nr:HEAT repeat domain-containing protein [Blastocatellia bacterium]
MFWWNMQLLKFKDYRARRRAIRGLSQSQDERAIDPVIAALDDRHYLVRKAAAQALGDFGGEHALAPLLTLAEDTFHYPMAKIAVDALQNVLGRAATNADRKDLEAAANLHDVSGLFRHPTEGVGYFSEENRTLHWTVDCSRIRALAGQEMIRRTKGGAPCASP